ncbi:uncharacterized protein LOC120514930 isoform X2 [Polypterus senegalus]|uniref:uncharacterized protein LOC120514930 isoform X2 n=1 Tax=Polypterus senegalus TaxID=55291 RepID=UPI00196581B1|nr:uncharacterized protein LOC120514930 isoform X2 [Polypterus senegalus]
MDHRSVCVLVVFWSLCLCAQGVVIKAQPGQNVSIHCELNDSEIYWFVEHEGQPLLAVVRTVDSMPIYSNGFGERHVIRGDNSLWILNVTSADSAHYHCTGRQEGTFIFSLPIYLHLMGDQTPTATEDEVPSKCSVYPWLSVVLGILLFTVIGLYVYTWLKLKESKRQTSVERTPRNDAGDPEMGAPENDTGGVYQEMTQRDNAVYSVCQPKLSL